MFTLKNPRTIAKRTIDPVIIQTNVLFPNHSVNLFHVKNVKYAKLWGPSSKFPGQRVGLKHTVKDKDIVEFITE